ncbi:DM13 domain-containing protein [Pseudahrensia aquimaris]|uniref:DM13 domain-containing protein n=1 Tax=Pseudahrensia aquimaris TaxID=744461 RepID=A0ABW3FCX4_9HYPH
MRRLTLELFSHGVVLAIGFALGIYFLPILTAPPSPDASTLEQAAKDAVFEVALAEGLRGNDTLHRGEGKVSITRTQIVHTGRLAPGPDYMVYLVPQFVEHKDEFAPLREKSRVIGSVKSFNGFTLDLPGDVDPAQFTTVLIWCEAFGEFIAAGKYR